MRQTEIEFFFPLTEQIPLDLDFDRCSPHEYYIRAKGIAGLHGPFPIGTQWVSDQPITFNDSSTIGKLTIRTSELTITGQKMPWYRKIIFKIMGFKYD